MPDLDLDVDTPEKVAEVLRRAADVYAQAPSDLSSAWGDRNAGKVWGKIAREIERCADRVQRITEKGY